MLEHTCGTLQGTRALAHQQPGLWGPGRGSTVGTEEGAGSQGLGPGSGPSVSKSTAGPGHGLQGQEETLGAFIWHKRLTMD